VDVDADGQGETFLWNLRSNASLVRRALPIILCGYSDRQGRARRPLRQSPASQHRMDGSAWV